MGGHFWEFIREFEHLLKVEEGTGLMRGTQSEEEEEARMAEGEMDDNYTKKQTSSSTWHAQGSGDGNRK